MDPRAISFPCPFPVKVFLRPDADTEAEIERRLRALLAPQAQLAVTRHLSSAGRYVCLTLTFTAADAEHARRVGVAMRDAPGVILAI